ncbi:hypothetical protein Tco_0711890 [Tanacetum coccineum]
MRNRILVYPDSNEEGEEYYSLPHLLPCFETSQPCAIFNSVHHNSHSEVGIDNMTLKEYARYELVEENIDVNTARELEEVQVKDVEMDEDGDIDYSNTEETLQWSPAKDPFLVCMEFNDQSSFVLHTIPSSISNEVKREFKIPHRFWLQGDKIQGHLDSCYVLVQVDAHGVVLGLYLVIGKHFKSGLVGYQAKDDDGLFLSCGCCSWKRT